MLNKINNKILYFLSGIFIIIAIINIFLGNILFNNTIIELYDPSNDINKAAEKITKSLEQQANRRALVGIKNNANTKLEAIGLKEEKENFNRIKQEILNNGKVNNCYTNFTKSLNIDKCVKNYRMQLILGLSYYNLNLQDKQLLINEICHYGQNSQEGIEKCIKENSIEVKPINIFKCKKLYNFNKELLKKCYLKSIDEEIYKRNAKAYMNGILKYNKKLIKIDNKGRVVTRKIDTKLIKEYPEYGSMFFDIKPYFVGLEINNNKKLENYPLLKDILIEYINKYNNLKKYDIFKYSKYKNRINDKIEIR